MYAHDIFAAPMRMPLALRVLFLCIDADVAHYTDYTTLVDASEPYRRADGQAQGLYHPLRWAVGTPAHVPRRRA